MLEFRWMLTVVSILFVSLTTFAWETDTQTSETFAQLKNASEIFPTNLEPNWLGNVPQFCKVIGYRILKESPVKDPDALGKDWVYAFVATLDRRRAFMDNIISPEFVELGLNAKPLGTQDILDCHENVVKTLSRPGQQAGEVKISLMKAKFLCGDVTTNAKLCAQSLRYLFNVVNPHEDTNLFETWETVLDDPTYIAVIKEIASLNWSRIQSGEIPQTRFFDDLYTAFLRHLGDERQAQEHAFNLLGVFASNGINTYNFIPCDTPSGFSSAIRVLSLTTIVLDQVTAAKGFLYTYPKEVPSLCDYGKNYHFWMTAFLARKATQHFGDARSAAAAAFTLDKGYQFMKDGGGRDRTKAFKENTFSNYSNSMRLDLAQAAAGAWYGAMSASSTVPKALSRDQVETGFKSVFVGAKSSPEDANFQFPSSSLGLLGAFHTWKKIINPDAPYRYFESLILPPQPPTN